jgi:hypothetical protein
MRCAVAAATPATMRVGPGPGHPGEVEEPQDVPVGDGAGDVDGLGEGLAEVVRGVAGGGGGHRRTGGSVAVAGRASRPVGGGVRTTRARSC